MALDVAPLVRAGAGLLYALVGAFFLKYGGASLRNRAAGVLYLASSISLIAINAATLDPAIGVVATVVAIVFAVAALAAGWLLVRSLIGPAPMPHRIRWAVASAVLLTTIGAAILLLRRDEFGPTFITSPDAPSLLVASYFSLFVAAWCVFDLGAIAALDQLRNSARSPAGTALSLLAFNLASQGAYLTGYGLTGLARSPILAGVGLLLPSAFAIAAVAWALAGTRGPLRRTMRNVALALCAFAAIGSLSGLAPLEVRSSITGIVRIVAFLPLAFAIFRLDLLGVPLRRVTIRAGTVASLALAALFITAQVAQNFLSDELGLYLGGAVAGIVVFAAYPLQRAAERRLGAGTKAEESFRMAVGLATRDRRVTAAEERQFVVLAHQLGLSPERAYAILAEGRPPQT